MDSRAIALAVPFFFALIGLEAWYARRRGARLHPLHDAINSLSCGVGQQVVYVFTAASSIAAYAWLHARFAFAHPSARSPLAWAALLLLVDHSFYWFHRASHRVNFMWAVHSVHHQSEEYNLTTALRQAWLEASVAWPFYLPIALLGFPPEMFALASTANSLYQFGIHTRTVGRLGRAEGVLNTPSSHRVHHAIDPEYIDKNYGGMLMLWDRLYGTYRPESREPTYGTVKPLESWNPLWANVEGFVRIWSVARRASRLRDRLYAWVAPPEWLPAEMGGAQPVPPVDPARYRKYDAPATRSVDLWVAAQFALVAGVTTVLLWNASAWPRALSAGVAAWIVASLVAWGGMLERRAWGFALEGARLAAAVIAVGVIVAAG